MTIPERIDEFLKGKVFGVIGASRDRAKYGNKILRCYLQHGLTAYPINPKETEIEGRPCFPDLNSLPEPDSRHFNNHTTACNRNYNPSSFRSGHSTCVDATRR